MTDKEIKALQQENEALKAQTVSLIEANEQKTAELKAEIEKLQTELKEAKQANVAFTKEVVGTYKSKKHGVTVSFKKGHLQTRIKGKLVSSTEIMENSEKYADVLDDLIEIKYAGLQIVKN
jgi:septal ring factor EnvC (AmiA/AmiB activator)